jgi:selenide,water dikinase
MRCGGCGAKLGASPLLRVLSRLPAQDFSQVALGIGDDAALVKADGDVILTVDGFRSLISDPYLFGRVTAHHSLNDVLAMGGTPASALALATVPLMAEPMMEDDLFQMLSGAVDVLNHHGAPLVGGHSAEGAELSLALTVTGRLDTGPLLTKSGLEPGDALILTKPLGTGVVLAAHMRALLTSSEFAAVLEALDASNADAVRVLRGHGVHALTDVSGFGFAGHLSEMLRASRVGADVAADAIPALPGARRLLSRGIESSLQGNNLQALDDYQGPVPGDPVFALLADPQTAGGLLAGVPAETAADCVATLRLSGYPQAVVVGRVTEAADGWRLTRGTHA